MQWTQLRLIGAMFLEKQSKYNLNFFKSAMAIHIGVLHQPIRVQDQLVLHPEYGDVFVYKWLSKCI